MTQHNFSKPNAIRFVAYWLGFFVVGQVLAVVFVLLFNAIRGESMEGLDAQSFMEDPASLRLMVLIGSIFAFIIPAIIYAKWFKGKYGHNYLDFKHSNDWAIHALIGIALIVVGTPLMALLIRMNVAIELPTWLSGILDTADYTLIERILDMPNILILIVNIILIGVIPALGEELIFRGIIQKGLYKLMNPHLAVIVAAFIFSLIHFQFDGLFARWFLGIVLGYSFWWSKNLWVPIVIHFANNSFQTLLAYFNPEYAASASQPELELPNMHWSLYILSAIFVVGIIMMVTKNQAKKLV